jgi:hypothetical protein
MTDLQVIRAEGRVWRIGRMPDPWAWPPWEAQHSDNAFGNRWDDPEGVDRVVYACSQFEGAYAEDGGPRFDGIEYESRLGDNDQNWAVLERPDHEAINQPAVEPVRFDDPALAAALAAPGLKPEQPLC